MAKEERVYNVPLRKEFLKVPRYKRAKKASSALAAFLRKHMKTEEVRIGQALNEEIWKRGMKNPPHHVKIHVLKDDNGIARAELVGKPIDMGIKEETEKKGGIAEKLGLAKKKAAEKSSDKKKEKEPKVEKKAKEEDKPAVDKQEAQKKEDKEQAESKETVKKEEKEPQEKKDAADAGEKKAEPDKDSQEQDAKDKK